MLYEPGMHTSGALKLNIAQPDPAGHAIGIDIAAVGQMYAIGHAVHAVELALAYDPGAHIIGSNAGSAQLPPAGHQLGALEPAIQ